ncbi:MAG: ATP-dependent chaperone ClpB, partial [Sulfurospirillum sp.]
LEQITKIVDILFNSIKKKLVEREIDIDITQKAKEHIAKEGFDPVYGARPLKRALYEEIEDRLAELILRDEVKEGDKVVFDEQNGEIVAKVN